MIPARAARLGLPLVALIGAAVTAAPAGAATTPRAGYEAACRRAGTVTADQPGPPAPVVAVSAPAALPPLPLPIVLRSTRLAVVARVVAVLYQGRPPRAPHHPPGFVGPIPPARCQVLRLQVVQTVLGTPTASLVVVKPLAPYLLQPSRRVQPGTFLLDDAVPYPTVLGLYGPSSYAPSAVRATLAATRP